MTSRVAAEVRLDLEQRKGEWEFTAWLGQTLIAEMRAVPQGPHVVIHLDVLTWSRGLYREYLQCFAAIRDFLAEQGSQLLFVSSERCDRKMKKFWRMMGFVVFGEIVHDGRSIPYAVMEA